MNYGGRDDVLSCAHEQQSVFIGVSVVSVVRCVETLKRHLRFQTKEMVLYCTSKCTA